MTNDILKTLLAALSVYEGDDLYRAQAAFRNLSPQDMQRQYGHSGQTCQQILDSYQLHANQVRAARDWLVKQPLNGGASDG